MFRFIVPLVAVLAYASAASVDECSWGESYWCSSLETAKACGAYEHCKTTVWRNENLKTDDSEVCQFCQKIVDDVTKFIKDNETEQQIVRFLVNACQMIPNKGVAAECEKIAQKFVVELIDMIATDVKPKIICSLMKLCTGLEDQVAHERLPSALAKSPVSKVSALPFRSEPICTDCKKFFTDIKNLIVDNATEAELEALIDQYLCVYLGTYKSMCESLVKDYLPEIMTLLSTEFDPNIICQGFGFCAQSTKEAENFLNALKLRRSALFKKASAENSIIDCDMCKTIMKELQDLDRSKAVQDDIKNFLKDNVCKHLGTYELACAGAVDIYSTVIFELLANELDPVARCRAFGFCAADNTIRDPVREATPVRAPVSPVPLAVGTTPQCVLCEFIMKELDSLISKNSTKEEIKAALNKVCNILPSTIKTDCLDFVKTYGDAIIDMLVQELRPDVICTLIGLCTSSERQIPQAVSNDMTCTVCETIVQYLEALLEQNATIAEVEAMLHKVCSFLPETIKPECNRVVDKYGPFIIQYISVALPPKAVCQMVDACPKVVEALEVKTLQKPLGANECTWGPKHWCASRENAKACSATAFCDQNGWLF